MRKFALRQNSASVATHAQPAHKPKSDYKNQKNVCSSKVEIYRSEDPGCCKDEQNGPIIVNKRN